MNREMIFFGCGILLAFFGWDVFRLLRLAAGAAGGAAVGWALYEITGIPSMLAVRGMEADTWEIIMILLFAAAGLFLLRLVRSLGTFLLGAILGFFSAKALMLWFMPRDTPQVWWEFSPPEAILAGIVAGAASLVRGKMAVVLMTSFLGSFLAGSSMTWNVAPLLLFGLSAPLQWWMHSEFPFGLRRKSRGTEPG